jgi:hypothetical protein
MDGIERSFMARQAVAMIRERILTRLFASFILAASFLLIGVSARSASAAVSSPGTNVHTFVTGLPDVPPPSFFAGVGPFGLTLQGPNRLLVSDAANQGLYSFNPNGSSAPNPISSGNVQTGLAFGKDGDLFAALYLSGSIDQVDPTTGAFVRQLNPPGTSYPCVTGLATDPISGDLFFGQPNSGGACPGNPAITRIENPASASPTFVSYTAQPDVYYTGLVFAPDGTLYAVQQAPESGCVVQISGTSSPSPPTITTIACFPNFQGEFLAIDAIAISSRPAVAPTLFVAGPSGTITRIDQSTSPATLTPIVSLPTRVDGLLVGPGRLYATQSTGIVSITNPDGPQGP